MRQVLGNAVLYSFIDESAAVRPAESAASLPLAAEQTQRGGTALGESDLALAGQY